MPPPLAKRVRQQGVAKAIQALSGSEAMPPVRDPGSDLEQLARTGHSHQREKNTLPCWGGQLALPV